MPADGLTAAKRRLRLAMRGLRRAGFRPWHGQSAADLLRHAVLPSGSGASADIAGPDTAGRDIAGPDIVGPGIVAGYWPMPGEADPLPALRMLAGHGWRTVLPDIVNLDGPGGIRAGRLEFRSWPVARGAPPPGAFGIPAPPPSEPALRPDLVLVPLLAADPAGRRLGQGAGFYDRALAALRQDGRPVLAVGWAMSAQVLRRVPDGPADMPLDWIVTERRAVRCRRQERTP
ncbi:MAG: 5-formyltetrahydrofolate cyclo-ligase [Roseitalea porphyridii]|uniref:5-formyltetrahydrofolate cyclo-ligase n=1 Tax=Roseitalea porphyridii TaxID=1852022 RepID=UPI0032EDA6BE